MNKQLELQFVAFLESSTVEIHSVEQARMFLEHAAECESCAVLMRDKPDHAEALLEAQHPAPEWTESEEKLILGVQSETLHFGDAILAVLQRENDFAQIQAALDKPLAIERQQEFWTLGKLPANRLHIALGGVAIKISVGSMLASSKESPARAVLSYDGLEVNGNMVPNALFNERIAGYAEIPMVLAERTWSVGRRVAIDERLGVPGIHWTPLSRGKIGLALTPKGIAAFEEEFASEPRLNNAVA